MLYFLGYTQEEFTEKFENRFSRMVYRQDRDRVLQEIEQQIRQSAYDECEYRIERKDYQMTARPAKLCQNCDMRAYCDNKNWTFAKAQ